MKKMMYLLVAIVACFALTGCGGEKNVAGNVTEIMDKLYEGISEDEMPMMLGNTLLDDDNFVNYAFTDKIKYKEAIVSESMTGSIAHSVVLIRLEDSNDAKDAIKEIKDNVDPRKWLCVEAENVYVLSKGDLVVLIMSNELAPKIKENFEKLE